MNVSIYLEPITKGEELIVHLLREEFGINEDEAKRLYCNTLKQQLEKLKDTCYLLAETKYVDKVYRDSYYHYYSSKLTDYKRYCIRISIFEGEIASEDFALEQKHEELQAKYRGFYVVRPTDPFIIGRNIVSPKALKNNHFSCCTTKIHTTAKGVKFSVVGFPHSSQDTETMSCAETSLWAIMEYFSNKYSDYKPVVPSQIIRALNEVSAERQIPSKGLNITQMSFALKEFGFGTRIYSHQEYHEQFQGLMSTYIESGIPIIVAMINDSGTIAHALLAVGHEKISSVQIDALPQAMFFNPLLQSQITAKNITFYDYDFIEKEFIFIDDNLPPYQKASFEKPAIHYPNQDWHSCQIKYFIVPLYTKIYLEAYEAKNYVFSLLTSGPEPLQNNSELLLRFYLASSRSFKDALSKNSSVQADLKILLLEAAMPKFIWVAELSSKDLMKQNLANGMIVLDATEANIFSNKPLILAAYQNTIVAFDERTRKFESQPLILQNFSVFQDNLKNI